jgi:hypothetical protein
VVATAVAVEELLGGLIRFSYAKPQCQVKTLF